MGQNTNIHLPADTRLDDACTVLGLLMGHERHLGESGNARWVEVAGVSATKFRTHTPEMVTISLTMPNGDELHPSYFFECEDGDRLFYPASTPLWCAVGDRLVKFFGGNVQYNDATEKYDLKVKKPRKRNNPSRDAEWDKFQAELWAIEPLSYSEVEAKRKVASCYDSDNPIPKKALGASKVSA